MTAPVSGKQQSITADAIEADGESADFIAAPDPHRGSSRIIKNVLMNWLTYAATILTGFFMSPFLVGHLGDSIYGVWVLIGSLAGYLGLLDFGITPATVKRVAEYRARGDQEAINRLVTGGLVVFTVLGTAALVVSCVLALSFNNLFHTPLDHITAAMLVTVVGLNLAISFPASVFVGMLRGYQRYDIDASVTLLTILLRSVLIVVLILRGYGILGLAGLTFAFDMARLAYLVRWAYRLNPAIRIARSYFHWQEMRGLFNHSSYFFLIAVGNHLNFLTYSIVIGMFLSTASVTVYFIANRLVTYLRELVVEMTGVLLPAISDLHASDNDARVRELHVLSTKYTLLLALPVSAVFFVMGDIFITLWMGPNYETSVLILRILTIGILVHLMGSPTGSVLNGLGKHQVVAQFTILQALTNLLLSLLLVKPFGLVGVALGTTISMVAFTLLALPIYFHYYLRLPLGSYLRRSMLLPLTLQLPFIALLVLLKLYLPPSSLLMFFGLVSMALIPYGAMALAIGIGQSERRAFLRLAGIRHGSVVS